MKILLSSAASVRQAAVLNSDFKLFQCLQLLLTFSLSPEPYEPLQDSKLAGLHHY